MTTIDGVIMTGSMGRHTKIPWNWTTGISIPNLNNLKRTGKVLLLFCDTVIVFIYQYKTNDVIIRVFDQCWVFVGDSWFIPFKLRRDLSSSSVFPLVILCLRVLMSVCFMYTVLCVFFLCVSCGKSGLPPCLFISHVCFCGCYLVLSSSSLNTQCVYILSESHCSFSCNKT